MPTDVKILISAEDDDFPLISVEYEDKKVEKIFKKDVLNNVEKELRQENYGILLSRRLKSRIKTKKKREE